MSKEIDKDVLIDLIRFYLIEVRDMNISVDAFINIVDSIYVYLKKIRI